MAGSVGGWLGWWLRQSVREWMGGLDALLPLLSFSSCPLVDYIYVPARSQTRLLSNALQGALFSVLYKYFESAAR